MRVDGYQRPRARPERCVGFLVARVSWLTFAHARDG